MTGGNTPNIVLKRMRRHFLKTPPLKRKYYNFRKEFAFFIKKTKKKPLQQMSGGEEPNLVLKGMLELFLKVPPLKKILIENLQNNLY